MEITFVFHCNPAVPAAALANVLRRHGYAVDGWNQQYDWSGCTPTLGDVSLLMQAPTVSDLEGALEIVAAHARTMHRVVLSRVEISHGNWLAANLNDYAQYVLCLPVTPHENSHPYPQIIFQVSGSR